ncbi:unnamed protein product [Symbiodinium necroappetens]|uniref:Uncharacterized protein n=1 Tax=Symbiodinium necroappetens TaxID=1628268 RepID=A0A812KF18_9DINO|nr:unnamed protein product [Symbiodinium necroappetens]
MLFDISSFYVVSLALALHHSLLQVHGDISVVQQHLREGGPWSRVYAAAMGLFRILRYQQDQSENLDHELLAIVLFVLSTARHLGPDDDAVMVDVDASLVPVALPPMVSIPNAMSFKEKLILDAGACWRDAAVELRDWLSSALDVLSREESTLARPAVSRDMWMSVRDLDDPIEDHAEGPPLEHVPVPQPCLQERPPPRARQAPC